MEHQGIAFGIQAPAARRAFLEVSSLPQDFLKPLFLHCSHRITSRSSEGMDLLASRFLDYSLSMKGYRKLTHNEAQTIYCPPTSYS